MKHVCQIIGSVRVTINVYPGPWRSFLTYFTELTRLKFVSYCVDKTSVWLLNLQIGPLVN